MRIPDGFELPERGDQLLPEHLRQQIRARLPVAVLAGERSVVLDAKIRRLNRDYRGVDAPTDVLSFSQLESWGGEDDTFPWLPGTPRLIGDIVISGERVRAQAAEFGHGQRRELAYLTVHGLLHLLGYDHESDAEKEKMRRAEEEALASIPRDG